MLTIAPPAPRAITRAADCATTKAAVTLSPSSRSSTASLDLEERLRLVAAGVVEQHVEALEALDRGAHRGGVGDVADQRPGAAALGLDLGSTRVSELGLGAAQRDDLRARLGERQRAAAADAAPRRR